MKTKTFLASFVSLVMVNASMIPVFANPIREQETSQKQEIPANLAQNSVIFNPATPDTEGAVQLIPVKDYIAVRGEASLEGKEILQSFPESSSVGNKDSNKEADKLALNSEADLFVVLPQGEALSSEELEQIEGEVYWFVPGLIGAGAELVATSFLCQFKTCTWRDFAWAAAQGFVVSYIPGGVARIYRLLR